jgi:predicted nucleotide-binding protein (sugar kinase/HSP70/actin superfamily)
MKIFKWISKLLKPRRGCLAGKNQDEKNDFFVSLSHFAITDPAFFLEQYHDLLPKEKKEFTKWVVEGHDRLAGIKSMLELFEKIINEK